MDAVPLVSGTCVAACDAVAVSALARLEEHAAGLAGGGAVENESVDEARILGGGDPAASQRLVPDRVLFEFV